jgi:hypothetical protein
MSVAAPVTARPAPAPNRTGLPDRLKVGIESLSGLDLSDVRVHSNSDKPAQFNALAYAQGNDIHVAPGQERHLPHEAWHVVQQAHGRVQPTRQMKDGIQINDDCGLEREADVMGTRAAQMKMHDARPAADAVPPRAFPMTSAFRSHLRPPTITRKPTPLIQRSVGFEFETSWLVSKADGTPFNKYDEIYTGGVNWNMEADTPSEGKSDVEFVVKPPFPENAGGLTTLRSVMPNMHGFFGNLIAAAGGHRNTLQGAGADPFVDAELQNNVVFTAGDENATPQTTVGVRLERLVALIDELSRPNSEAKSELLDLAGRSDQNATMLHTVSDVVKGTATTWALHDNNRPTYIPSAAMKGLVSLLVLYLRRGAVIPGTDLYAQAFKYAKMVTIIMGRTNFAGMFQQLPQVEKDYYIDRPNHWVQFVLDAAQASMPAANFAQNGNVIARGLKGDPPKYAKAKIVKPGKVIPIPIQRREWLLGMLVGADLLNEETFERYNPGQTANFSGAFGALGTQTDDVGALQAHKGVILELREVKHDMDYRDWAQFAEDVFNYVMLLNAWDPATGAAAPQYTKTATPARGVRP